MSSRSAIVIVWVVCLCLPVPGLAQNCLSSLINLHKQSDVNNFQAIYGPCNRVVGELNIEEFVATPGDELTDLTPLSGLTEVDGFLYIQNNKSLTSLTGLENLTTVDGLYIQGHRQLSNLTGLSGLTSVFHITIASNYFLDNLGGLPDTLQSLESLFLRDNEPLLNLQGLPATLTSIKRLIINEHSELLSLDGLPAMVDIESLRILNNRSLTDLSALSASTFSMIDPTETSIGIESNASLTNLMGLPPLQKIGEISIRGNGNLESLAGLDALQEVWSYLEIRDNEKLSDCSLLFTVLDPVDDGDAGPGPVTNPDDPPDSPGFDNIWITNNLPGCNSIEEITDSGAEVIFGDGFEGN